MMLQCSQRMECGGIITCTLANQLGRDHALRQTPQYAAQPDIDVQDVDHLAVGFVLDLERYVGDADHFAALAIDDLLIEKIAHQAQHVFVGMIRGEHFVFEVNAVERNGADLIVTNG